MVNVTDEAMKCVQCIEIKTKIRKSDDYTHPKAVNKERVKLNEISQRSIVALRWLFGPPATSMNRTKKALVT